MIPFRRLVSALLLFSAIFSWPLAVQAHDIPSRVTVFSFVKPQGDQLTVLLRVPMEALSEVVFPLRGPGYLRISESEDAQEDAARVYITESMHFYEDGVELAEKELVTTRVSLPSNHKKEKEK